MHRWTIRFPAWMSVTGQCELTSGGWNSSHVLMRRAVQGPHSHAVTPPLLVLYPEVTLAEEEVKAKLPVFGVSSQQHLYLSLAALTS